MNTRVTVGRLTVIGIALGMLGIAAAKHKPMRVLAQRPITSAVDRSEVRIVPSELPAALPTMPSKPPALTVAERQRLLRVEITSFQQQLKANPGLDQTLPVSDPPTIPPAPVGVVLTPTQPYYNNGGGVTDKLSFLGPDIVVPGPSGFAWWNGGKGALTVDLAAVTGKVYLLDISLHQNTNALIKVQLIQMLLYNHKTITLEMRVTAGHILVPLVASVPNWEIEVSSPDPWLFYSVEMLRLN
jgi:hypothetical protein